MAALFIGEWVSTKTRAMVPSIFVTALIFIIGFWTIFPEKYRRASDVWLKLCQCLCTAIIGASRYYHEYS
ncbi:hypothetical protein [Enterococcus italicus]|uniref:hypothetical protein n=1 Tax=Enterococcus italicus TaxID=246144 RepID=UPI003FA26450